MSLMIDKNIPNTEIGRAFKKEMEGHDYGEETLLRAWAWFLNGWNSNALNELFNLQNIQLKLAAHEEKFKALEAENIGSDSVIRRRKNTVKRHKRKRSKGIFIPILFCIGCGGEFPSDELDVEGYCVACS